MTSPSIVRDCIGVTREELIRSGYLLYGRRWRQPLAETLEVSPSTLRRWTNGHLPITRQTELAIRGLLAEKAQGERVMATKP